MIIFSPFRARVMACLVAVMCASQASPGSAQAPRPAPAQATAAAAPAPAGIEDPLRRDTPRGCFMGFIEASRRRDWKSAAEYLQWPRQKMPVTREEAAEQLSFVLNHGFEGNLDRISRDPAGSADDGLQADRERVGTAVLTNGERVDLHLVRVARQGGPSIWLIAADAVADTPRMYWQSGLPDLERRLPRFLMAESFGKLPLWVPLVLLVFVPVLYAVSKLLLWCVVTTVRFIVRWRGRSTPVRRSREWLALSRPSAFLLTLALHRLMSPRIGMPLLHRQYYSRAVTVIFLAGIVWWLWRAVDLLAERTRDRLRPDHPRTAQTVYMLGRRVLKGAVFGLALLIGLAAFGVDLTTTLAGLGIGGVALAFASQKTLENVFGGMFVLSDRSIVVGDFCRIGQHVGEVVDVGLRSMQLRTLNRTVVYVPNGTLATMEVENLSRRDKFLFNPTLGLRYETTRDQLDRVAAEVRALLASDARVEDEKARVRFVRFGAYTLDVEVFAYVKAADYPSFLAVQEELLMRVMDIVKAAGTGFAFPSQTMYMRSDPPAPQLPPAALNR